MQGESCPECRAALVLDEDVSACARCGWARRRDGRLWLADRDFHPEGFDLSAAERLSEVEQHFWTRGRRRLVKRLLERIALRGSRAIELGCGTGGLLALLEDRFERVTAVDAHASLLGRAARASARTELVQADVTRTPLPSGQADLVLALDVIEHVAPEAFLAEALRLAAPDGVLLLSAPATPSLWSRMDERAGHRCRYTRRSMAGELTQHGFRPFGFTHYQCLLFPLVWLSHVLGKRDDARFERRPSPWLDAFLGGVNQLELTLFGGLALPFGSTLFMWAAPAGGGRP